MILSDSEIFTSGSPLTSAGFGAGVCLTLNPTGSFAIDTGILTGQAGVPVSNVGFRDTGDILAGQMVRAKVNGAATGTNGVNATATQLILRFSRLTGNNQHHDGNQFQHNGPAAVSGDDLLDTAAGDYLHQRHASRGPKQRGELNRHGFHERAVSERK